MANSGAGDSSNEPPIWHIIIAVIGSKGDVFPYFQLAKALSSRGHRITILTNAVFRSHVVSMGLEFAELGTLEEFEHALNNRELFSRKGQRLLLRILAQGIERAYTQIAKLATSDQTLMLTSQQYVPGSRVANEKLGIPLIVGHVGASSIWSAFQPPHIPALKVLHFLPPIARRLSYWVFDHFVLDPILSPELHRLRQTLNLPGRVRRIYSRWLLDVDFHLGLFPAWFAAPARDWPKGTELVGFPFYEPNTDLPSELEAFLKQGSKPIVFTPSSANWHARSFFVESLRACEMGEFRGVFIGPLNQMPKNLPATIFATEWAPFGSLFDAASAVVHPAAIGTGALAIRAGIPQLLVPMAHDQFDNAAHFTKLGVASLLPPARYKAKAVVRELRQLVLDSDVRNNTRALQERLVREPKAEQIAANLICDFINRRGPRAAPGPRVSSVAV